MCLVRRAMRLHSFPLIILQEHIFSERRSLQQPYLSPSLSFTRWLRIRTSKHQKEVIQTARSDSNKILKHSEDGPFSHIFFRFTSYLQHDTSHMILNGHCSLLGMFAAANALTFPPVGTKRSPTPISTSLYRFERTACRQDVQLLGADQFLHCSVSR